jgi:hypothetical protein
MCFILVLHMFHTYVASVSLGCCIYFYIYIASVSFRCCICFAMATHVFPSCLIHMLQVFQLFRMYVANVFFGYYKSRSGVTQAVICCWARLQVRGCGRGMSGKRRKSCRRRSRRSGRGTRKAHETPREAGCARGRLDTSPRLDVWMLAFLQLERI